MSKNTFYPNPHIIKINRRRSYWISLSLACATLVLLAAGATVTSTGSSLAVPDWPLAYGEFFPPMVGGILYEHGHRLIATLVGMMTLIMGGWLWWSEQRRWVKWLGIGAIGLVIFQGVMGGITVIFLIPKAVSISHALLAQLFFLLTVLITQVTSPAWDNLVDRSRQRGEDNTGRVGTLGGITLLLLLLEILIGATVRHNYAGLAIPDFPLAYGGLIPPLSSFPIVIHFIHRVVAVIILFLVAYTVWETLRNYKKEKDLFWAAILMGVLTVVQILLGGIVIWSQLAVPFTVLHLVNGAMLVGVTGILFLRARVLEMPNGGTFIGITFGKKLSL